MAGPLIGVWLFAACLLLSWTNSAMHLLHADRLFYSRGPELSRIRPRTRQMAILGAASGAYLGAVLSFARGVVPAVAGVIALIMLAAIRRYEVRTFPDRIVVRLGKYVPTAAALGGWLVAWALTWGHPADVRAAAGWEAACGVMGAAWGLAAVAKLRESGLVWMQSANVALLVAERSFSGPAPVRALRRAVAWSPRICRVAAVVGLVGEAAAVAFVVPELRWPVAAFATALQLGIWTLLGYWELEWLVLMVALALASGA